MQSLLGDLRDLSFLCGSFRSVHRTLHALDGVLVKQWSITAILLSCRLLRRLSLVLLLCSFLLFPGGNQNTECKPQSFNKKGGGTTSNKLHGHDYHVFYKAED